MKAKQPDKQLNIRMKAAAYRKIQAAARREKLTITAYSRGAIMDRVSGAAFEGPGLDGIPAWLLHVLLFFAPRRPSKSEA